MFLQYPQQFCLEYDIQIADLVQKDAAALGQLEFAGLGLLGPGEGPFFIAEQLALQQGAGDGGAVDPDKGGGGPVTPTVDGVSK